MSHKGHEFKVHHHVSELMSLLGVKPTDGPGAEVYTEMLLKHMTPYITTQVSAHNSKKKIAETTPTFSEFLKKYDELKSRNVRELDPMVFLLSKISEDTSIKGALCKNAETRASATGVSLTQVTSAQIPASGSKVTPEELDKIKEQLMKATTAPLVPLVDTSAFSTGTASERAHKNVNLPMQPDWIFHRPYLSMDFVLDDTVPEQDFTPAADLSVQQQTDELIEDLLYCMQGIDGKYIKALPLADRYAPREFDIDQDIDISLRELVSRILPLCSNYSVTIRFIEEKSAFEYGLVNHALSSAMVTLIKDYLVLIAQLEQKFKVGNLGLQTLWFFLQPTMRTMEILASIANAVNKGECIGGAVLSLLHERTYSFIGEPKAHELCMYLTQSACVPYFEILEKWIYKGIIKDPYSEFLIEEHESFDKENLQKDYNDAYWQQHYTICQERCPLFLEKVAHKILNTGKYLNVVRQCGKSFQFSNAEEIVYTVKERLYYDQIDQAYEYASRLLLEHMLKEKQLLARIKSIKHYFLLDQGDVIFQFMDMAEDELKKTMDEIMPTRLESLLELALRTSTANEDPFKDDLKVDLLPFDLITQLFRIHSIEGKKEKEYVRENQDLCLSGLEGFTFNYVTQWPVSLILNRKSLTRYQLLFRHLFYCKHVERQLCSVWVSNKTAKMYTLFSTRWFAAGFALRQRMLNFIQNFEYYMFEVIDTHWYTFSQKMNKAENIDEVLECHTDFLSKCLNDCMLNNPDLLKTVHKLTMVSVTFSNFIQRLNQTTNIESEVSKLTQVATLQAAPTLKDRKVDPEKKKTTTKVVAEDMDQLAGSENFERTINKFDENFTKLLVSLLDQLQQNREDNCDNRLMTLFDRLNFNGFYSEQIHEGYAHTT